MFARIEQFFAFKKVPQPAATTFALPSVLFFLYSMVCRGGTYPVVDGHEEDEPRLGKDVDHHEEDPAQQELGPLRPEQAGICS